MNYSNELISTTIRYFQTIYSQYVCEKQDNMWFIVGKGRKVKDEFIDANTTEQKKLLIKILDIGKFIYDNKLFVKLQETRDDEVIDWKKEGYQIVIDKILNFCYKYGLPHFDLWTNADTLKKK